MTRLSHVFCLAFSPQVKSDTETVDEGGNVTLSCSNDLFIQRPVRYLWQKYGQKNDIAHYSVNYTLRNVTLEASGVYLCTVLFEEEAMMRVRKNITLSVQGLAASSSHCSVNSMVMQIILLFQLWFSVRYSHFLCKYNRACRFELTSEPEVLRNPPFK